MQRAEAVHQAEVGHLHMIADQEEVARLDIQVLQAVPVIEEIERLRRLA